MNVEATGTGRRRRSKWWWFVLALGVVGVAYLGYALVAPRRALEAAKSKLRAAGVRLTVEDCVGPQVPEHQVAARRFTAAAQSLSGRGRLLPDSMPRAMEMVAPGKARVGWQQAELPEPPGGSSRYAALLAQRYGIRVPASETNTPPPPPRPTWEDLAVELQACLPALREVGDATKVAEFDWNLDYSLGFEIPLPHLGSAKSAVQRLVAATLLALHQGRRDDALEFLETQLRIVRAFPRHGLLIGELVRIAMGAIAWNTTWELLQADGWSDAQLRRLQQAWQETEYVDCMIRGLEMERALALREYARCREDPGRLASFFAMAGGSGGTAPTPSAVSKPSDLLEWMAEMFRRGGGGVRAQVWAWFKSWDDERFYLEFTHTLIEEAWRRSALGRPPRTLPLSLPAGEAFVPEAPLGVSAQLELRRHLLAEMISPSLNKAMAKAFLVQMQREMAITAIALKRYQLQHGVLPENLAELVPALLSDVPLDWMDGRPLRYRRLEGRQFLLYSVSNDGIDQGGDPTPAEGRSKGMALHLGRDFVWPEAETP